MATRRRRWPQAWPAGGVLGTTRSAERAAAMRAAGVEPVDWADAAAVDGGDRGGRATAGLAAAGRGRRPGAGAARRGAGGGAGRAGSAISRRRGSMATGRAAGSTRTGALAPVQRARRAGGWRRRRAWLRDRAAGAGLPARRDLRAGAQRPRPAARGAGAAGGEAGAGLQPHPCRRHRRGCCGASMARPAPGRAYNVADDEPAPPQDVIAYAAGLLGLPVPPEVRVRGRRS